MPLELYRGNGLGMLGMSNKIKVDQTLQSIHDDHIIDFDNANIIDKGKFRCRLTLESWHTAKDKNADNNSKPLPRQYTAQIKKTLS